MSFRKDITSFINNLKSNRNFAFKIKPNSFKRTIRILPKLLKYNYISKYIFKDGYIHIFKNTISNKVTLTFVPKHMSNVTYFELQSLMYKNPTCIFIASTSIGILDNDEMRKLEIGGSILFVIKYVNTL